jgi:hypothetical protein
MLAIGAGKRREPRVRRRPPRRGISPSQCCPGHSRVITPSTSRVVRTALNTRISKIGPCDVGTEIEGEFPDGAHFSLLYDAQVF